MSALRHRGRRRRVVWLALLACLAPAAASAQRVGVQIARAPYYVAVPVDIEVQAEGFAKEPTPTCTAPDPDGGSLGLLSVSPHFESSIRIVNGRMTRTKVVRFTCHFRFTAQRAGSFELGPFEVRQDGQRVATSPLTVRVQKVSMDPRLRLRVHLPDHPVYIGQHVPVDIEWWLAEELSNKIHGFSLRSPLFAMDDDFRFIDDELAGRGDQVLPVETSEGELRLKAEVTKRKEGGRAYLVLRARRTLIPMRAKEYRLAAAQVEVDEVVKWRRDLFGGRSPRRTRKLLGADQPRRLVVREPPLRDRPESYAGAVGQGFSIDVTADRSVVQQGDPIVLNVSIRGDGNLEVVGLPPLSADDGLPSEKFRLPTGEAAGRMEGDAKVFEVTVRVLDADVREVPTLAYSWFNPESGEYETARSRPIALSVREARMVTASDVVSALPEPEADGARESGSAESPPGPGAARPRTLSLTGADLSIERDVDRLLASPGGRRHMELACYAAAVLALVFAGWARRRGQIDPERLRRRRALAEQRERVSAAGSMARSEAVAAMAAGLRELLALAPELRDDDCDRFLQECDDLLYAPAGREGEALDAGFQRRALEILDRMGEKLA